MNRLGIIVFAFAVLLPAISGTSYGQMAEGAGCMLSSEGRETSTYIYYGLTSDLVIKTREVGDTNLQYRFAGAGFSFQHSGKIFGYTPFLGFERAILTQTEAETSGMKQFIDRLQIGIADFPERGSNDIGYAVSTGYVSLAMWDGLRDRFKDGGVYASGKLFWDYNLTKQFESRLVLSAASKFSGTDLAYNLAVIPALAWHAGENVEITLGLNLSSTRFNFQFHGQSKTIDIDDNLNSFFSTEKSMIFGVNIAF
ncbi:MAG: hypothetical protein HZA48_02360 [Planctomycetes bacterium]|nr:hypothetical protein [Planctomycetota bacterium]